MCDCARGKRPAGIRRDGDPYPGGYQPDDRRPFGCLLNDIGTEPRVLADADDPPVERLSGRRWKEHEWFVTQSRDLYVPAMAERVIDWQDRDKWLGRQTLSDEPGDVFLFAQEPDVDSFRAQVFDL
jgi:hypothetical protein